MRSFIVLLLGISCLFVGCYYPPLNKLPLYGYPEKTLEEIKADSTYQKDLAWAQDVDSAQEKAKELIAEGFSFGYGLCTPYFNRAWLLDSLNPHIYMGFAERAMHKQDTKKAIEYYIKYRELYQKNPSPRPRSKYAPNYADRANDNPANHQSLIYGKLLSLKKDDGRHWEMTWPGVAISEEDYDLRNDFLQESNIIPENERYILILKLFNDKKRKFYTAGRLKIIEYFDKETQQWVKAPEDSVYEFSYVEHQGMFFNEEMKSLVTLGQTSTPDSSARIFLLKPYAKFDDDLVINSYSEYIPYNSLHKISPRNVHFKPYQIKFPISIPAEIPVRSSIIRALGEGKLDSLRTYLNAALRLEKYYGAMPISDYEFSLLNLLDKNTVSDSTVYHKIYQELNSTITPWINHTLHILIAYRSYPYVFSDEFNKKINALPKSSLLKDFAQRPYSMRVLGF